MKSICFGDWTAFFLPARIVRLKPGTKFQETKGIDRGQPEAWEVEEPLGFFGGNVPLREFTQTITTAWWFFALSEKD